jgi:hypothetical protein
MKDLQAEEMTLFGRLWDHILATLVMKNNNDDNPVAAGHSGGCVYSSLL